MSVMAPVRTLDPQPIVHFMRERGGECSFDEAMQFLRERGLNEAEARDGLWGFLSQGVIEFTTDRHLRLPQTPALERVAG